MGKLTEAVSITNGNLICDATGCDYAEPLENIPPPASLIGKRCPKCGANLLTEADYNAGQQLLAMFANINAEIGPIEESGKAIKLSLNPRAE